MSGNAFSLLWGQNTFITFLVKNENNLCSIQFLAISSQTVVRNHVSAAFERKEN